MNGSGYIGLRTTRLGDRFAGRTIIFGGRCRAACTVMAVVQSQQRLLAR
jgi:hypothetical protein